MANLTLDKKVPIKNRRTKRSKRKYKRGDIVFVDLRPSLGSEQGGVRPCVIIQNDVGNAYSTTTVVCPTTNHIKTSKSGKLQPTHYVVENFKEVGLPKESMLLFEQVRTIDKSRILDDYPIGHIDMDNEDIQQCLLNVFFFGTNKQNLLSVANQ